MKNTKKVIKDFSTKRILVIGDLMVDFYTYGNVSRISPEAPVPIVHKTGEKYVPGGAANVANNLASLGATVTLCGVIGKDHTGEVLKELLLERGIGLNLLFSLDNYPTTIKQRVVSGSHQFLRIDDEKKVAIDIKTYKKMLVQLDDAIKNSDAIILSDYAKGFFSKQFARSIIKLAKKYKKIVIADIRPQNKQIFKNIDIITPNLSEAIALSGTENMQKIGKKLMTYFKSDVLVTKGAEGITVFEKLGKTTDIAGEKIQVFDVSGAGDTVIAVATLCVSSGLDLVEAAVLANSAGGIVVQKTGTASLTQEELEAVLGDKGHIDLVEIVPKLWGYEKWLENNERYCSKLLSLNKGYQCSLHYHKIKDETFIVTKGHVRLEVGDEVIHMRPGNFQRIPPNTKHRFRGMEDSLIIEVSTHHREDDSYRIEKSRKV